MSRQRTISKAPRYWTSTGLLSAKLLCLLVCGAAAQEFNVQEFDPSSAGPWSSAARTLVSVPIVGSGAVVLDGMLSDDEYGGFVGVPVIPGHEEHGAWILDQPTTRSWDGPEDSSFTFWLAHDADYLYIGAQTLDDTVHLDDDGGSFSNDDSLAIVIDALNNRYDRNAGTAEGGLGGYLSVGFNGQISGYDFSGQGPAPGANTFFPDGGWEFGEGKDVYSVGGPVEGGWAVEMQIRKSLMEADGNEITENYLAGFNIGVADNDNAGLENDVELEYWWANRNRFVNWSADESLFYTEDAIAQSLAAIRLGADNLGDLGVFLSTEIGPDGRLRGGGAGEIIFEGGVVDPLDCNGDGMVDTSDLDCVTSETIDAMRDRLNLLPGDFNGDGNVDFFDFIQLSLGFGKEGRGYTGGDNNVDGSVDFVDFISLSLNFGKSSTAAAAAVPEPSSGVLFGALLLMVAHYRRRKLN